MICLVDNAPPGTQVTCIFQPTESKTREFSHFRKTVFKIEKMESGEILLINMDGGSNDAYGRFGKIEAYKALQENGNAHDRASTKLNFLSQKLTKKSEIKADSKSDLYSRQNDDYQCGIFAIKDARQLTRNPDFSKSLKTINEDDDSDLSSGFYDLPPQYLKNIQSREYSQYILNEHGDEVVTRKGKTLRQTHEHYNVSGYSRHFSEKLHKSVADFLEANKDNPEKIRKAVEMYDADKMTLDRINKVDVSVSSSNSVPNLAPVQNLMVNHGGPQKNKAARKN